MGSNSSESEDGTDEIDGDKVDEKMLTDAALKKRC